ncbi:cytochrome P450 [Nocardia bovistercoris]|uniref:Cytochrome P450 n=1 Tax=Nocardia bovistercoris TaxID=2785916 RepID=A0A931I9R2_9NOCA|nr:cytochrome P450 [Nocardia bovistercoris]
MADTKAVDLYYDPYDFDIDSNPYPVWKRLRAEAPLYYNDRHNFYAVSRYDDVAAALADWETFRSGRGTVADVIFSGAEIPPGIILWEDPPIHDVHRKLLAKVFSPRRMLGIESQVRNFCVKALDPLVGTSEFDVIADFGALMPMRTIGYLLGIPEADQAAIRDSTDEVITLKDGESSARFDASTFEQSAQVFAEYIEWRAEHPSDDLMTELLDAEVEEDGVRRKLTRLEVLTYTSTVAGAGNETTTRLIGFMAQLLAENPEQRAQLVAEPGLIPRAVEETLRFEPPSPVQARYVARDARFHDQTVPEGSVILLLNGSANRDERRFSDPDRFDIHRDASHLGFGYGLHFCLGAALARLEGRIALEELLRRWPKWDIDYDNAARAHTSSVRGWGKLPLIVSSGG